MHACPGAKLRVIGSRTTGARAVTCALRSVIAARYVTFHGKRVRMEWTLTRTVKELGWRCSSYSNSNIAFNKAILFGWAGGDGPAATSCC
jgi:hypothetical protein